MATTQKKKKKRRAPDHRSRDETPEFFKKKKKKRSDELAASSRVDQNLTWAGVGKSGIAKPVAEGVCRHIAYTPTGEKGSNGSQITITQTASA